MKRSLWLGLAAATICAAFTHVPAEASSSPGPPDRATARAVAARAPIGALTLGRVAPVGAAACISSYLWYQAFEDPNQTPYRVPYDGVVTSVSHFANAVPGQIEAAFIAPTGTDFVYAITQKSAKLTLTPNRLNTFPVRMPVHAGEILTLRTIDLDLRCLAPGGTIDQVTGEAVLDGDTTFGPPTFSQLHSFVNISAVLEPDVDGDGYGDVSQDHCPTLAAAHDPCPAPVVTIKKAPKKRISSHRVKIKFTSDVPGSTFACSVDGRAFKGCRSPYKGRVVPGTHTVRVEATSPVGVVGQPVTVQFTVVSPHHP